MYAIEHRCAQALAREAGQRMQDERRRGFEIDYKGTNNLVTTVDRSIERFLREEIKRLFPHDAINGEEYGEKAQDSQGVERKWLVDPIDGTTNFSKGIPIYCVSIGFQVDGQTVVGAIYDPNRDELFSAHKGHGAWLNGRKMQVSDEPNLDHAIVVTGFPPIKEGTTFEQIIAKMTRVAASSRGLRRFGSAALDLAHVAAGRVDAFWEYSLNPWDTAAGYLMVQEAGGTVTDDQRGEFDAHNASVVATNGKIHDAMLAVLASL